jgi:hypothetical protein
VQSGIRLDTRYQKRLDYLAGYPVHSYQRCPRSFLDPLSAVIYILYWQEDGTVGLESDSMSEVNVIFRTSCLNQLKVVIPKNVRQQRPQVAHWRLQKEDNKIQRVNLDKTDVAKNVVSLDQAAIDEILDYMSACT